MLRDDRVLGAWGWWPLGPLVSCQLGAHWLPTATPGQGWSPGCGVPPSVTWKLVGVRQVKVLRKQSWDTSFFLKLPLIFAFSPNSCNVSALQGNSCYFSHQDIKPKVTFALYWHPVEIQEHVRLKLHHFSYSNSPGRETGYPEMTCSQWWDHTLGVGAANLVWKLSTQLPTAPHAITSWRDGAWQALPTTLQIFTESKSVMFSSGFWS